MKEALFYVNLHAKDEINKLFGSKKGSKSGSQLAALAEVKEDDTMRRDAKQKRLLSCQLAGFTSSTKCFTSCLTSL